MYVDNTGKIFNDDEEYTSSSGISYPKGFCKRDIKELHRINETTRPTGDIIILGFHIDESYTQVWDYREKTEKELINEKNISLKQEIKYLEKEITSRRIREALFTDEGKFWLEEKELEIQELRVQLSS